MRWTPKARKLAAAGVLVAAVVLLFELFSYDLAPVASASADPQTDVFAVTPGESFSSIISGLRGAGLVRSALVAEAYALFTGKATAMQPGAYKLSPSMSAPAILGELSGGVGREVTVTIAPDSNIYQIDATLANALVLRRGALIAYASANPGLEGKLFPDTYRFFTGSDPASVVEKILGNFNAKAETVVANGPVGATTTLVLASIIEKEVPDSADQSLVAGILIKRERAGIPLQVDSTICYAMQAADPSGAPDCGSLDLKIDSPYNTYLYKGFPPGPIGSPDLSAIEAAVSPKSSPYWYYLSDPKTGKTIYATTLDEQHRNTVKYLENN